MLISGTPVKLRSFAWESSFNASYNISKVIELAGGQQSLVVGYGSFTGQLAHEVGQPLGSIQAIGYQRTADGQIINSGGRPNPTAGYVTYGSALPKWVGGFNNIFTYKEFRFSFLIDFKLGHKLISNTNFNLYREGLTKETLVGRGDADLKLVGPGVKQNGTNPDGSPIYVPNDERIEVQTYYETVRARNNIGEPFVYNAGFIQLRQMALGYNFGKLLKNNKFFKGATFSLISNNVLLLKKWVPNLHPEQISGASDNLSGLEGSSLPLTRSFGANLNVKF